MQQCRAAAAALRGCVQTATSHTERCCALLRAAGAAVAAIDAAAASAAELGTLQQHELHGVCAAVLAVVDLAIVRVKVRHVGIMKLAAG